MIPHKGIFFPTVFLIYIIIYRLHVEHGETALAPHSQGQNGTITNLYVISIFNLPASLCGERVEIVSYTNLVALFVARFLLVMSPLLISSTLILTTHYDLESVFAH